MITAKAPTRIDLCGGTIDIWPLYLFHQPAITINVAINLYATAQITPKESLAIEIISHDQNQTLQAADLSSIDPSGLLPLIARLLLFFAPDQGVRLETKSSAPAGSGLGGSSALAIAVCGALNEFTGRNYGKEDLIEIARDIEAQVLGIPTGLQDYYAGMYGGLNGWEFGIQKPKRHTYSLPLSELNSSLVLFYSGLPRNSGINNWQVFKNRIDNEPNTVKQLAAIHHQALQLHESLRMNEWNRCVEAIGNEWEARKLLAPSITTAEIEEIIDWGISQGALAGRVCGAGGGGCLILACRPGMRQKLETLARSKGYNTLDFQVVKHGLEIVS